MEVQVSLNGDPISGLLQAVIATTNTFSADTYSLTFAIGGSASNDMAFWSLASSAYIEVTAVISSAYGSTYQSLIVGMADAIHVDPIMRTVAVEGRDLSSSMIDSYRQQDFVNQTASEIVSTIAQYHGLQPVVTATSGNVGRYYGDGYTKLSLGQFSRLQSDWDLLVQLARQNAFDVFVDGKSLYFQPAGSAANALISISLLDTNSVQIERDFNISTNTTARVQSWDSQNLVAYNSDNPSSGAAVNQGASAVNQPFLFLGSNYTSQQVADAAVRYAAEATRLGTILHLDMPWDLSLAPRATILLDGTGSTFDTIYMIDSIERHYSSTSGSRQLIRAAQV
jgi:phage protein D